MMKNIALIYMGGTFGCIGMPLSPMPAEDFLPQLQHVLPLDLNIKCLIAPMIQDSSACTATDWLALTHQMQSLEKEGFSRFVIIHGTDTMSYAAAVLSRFMGHQSCIVITGSQYPLLTLDGLNTREFSDAQDNLNLALKAVTQYDQGVYLAFHQHVIHGSSALKQHTTQLDAFAGIGSDIPIKRHLQYPIQTADIEKSKTFNCLSFMLQPIHITQQNQNLQQLLSHPPTCLILQGFGTANFSVNNEILETLTTLYEKGCAIVLTTQVPFGEIDQHYAINSWLATAPVLLSNCHGHADLYAKILKMYLQYDCVEQWATHWQDH